MEESERIVNYSAFSFEGQIYALAYAVEEAAKTELRVTGCYSEKQEKALKRRGYNIGGKTPLRVRLFKAIKESQPIGTIELSNIVDASRGTTYDCLRKMEDDGIIEGSLKTIGAGGREKLWSIVTNRGSRYGK